MPIASIDSFVPEKLGKADLVEEVATTDGKLVKITGVPNASKTVSVLVRGSNKLVLDEADRSLHDALCVIRSIVKKRYVLLARKVAYLLHQEPYCRWRGARSRTSTTTQQLLKDS